MLRIDYGRQRESGGGRAEERLQRRAAANACRPGCVDSGHRDPERGVVLVVHEPKSIPGAGRGPAAANRRMPM